MAVGPVRYIGRFAPSPTGPLHAGSLVAALASWLDARAHGPSARWLVRIEDLDRARCVPGAAAQILRQLHALQLIPDEAPLVQSQRQQHYGSAIARLKAAGLLYPCSCSRKDVLAASARQGLVRTRHGELVYPGTCRDQLHGTAGVSLRLRCDLTPGQIKGQTTDWTDRRLGPQAQDVAREVGDFVLLRADGLPTYQLAVVVDDAAQGVTDVVRGEDLADNTARQILLQNALGLARPRYLHAPLVRDAAGEKLSKQSGASAIDTSRPLAALNAAATTLGLTLQGGSLAQALEEWVGAWRGLYNPEP